MTTHEIEIDEVTAVTEKAIGVTVSETGAKLWIPRSVITDTSAVEADADVGDSGVVEVARWWADKNNLLEEE
jgi:hypothetical protein